MRRGLFCLLGLTAFMGAATQSARAQTVSSWGPKYARPERALNLFAQWGPGSTFDAVRISLPDQWRLRAVEEVDESRMKRLPLRLRRAGRDWIAEAASPLIAPLRVVITAVPAPQLGVASIRAQATNFVQTRKGVVSESVGDAVRFEVPIEQPRRSSGHALRLEQAAVLQHAPDEDTPLFPSTGSFTVEYWFQTVDRDVILLSTWNGDEGEDYPFEFIIDAGGNVRCYSGQNGMHYSVVSDRPAADGSWHHVAYVRDVEAHMASLYVDGREVDSVYLPDQTGTQPYPITVGGRTGETTSSLTGLFDELRVWAEPRSAEVISAEARLPGRGLVERPVVLVDFETPLPPSLEGNAAILDVSDLALHQPVHGARVEVRSGAVEVSWRLTGGEGQTVSLERSTDGVLFAPIYLVVAGSRENEESSFDRSYSFQDVDVDGSSVFYYRFTQDFRDGSRLVSSTLKVGLGASEEPLSFNLIGNSPNPFVTSTRVIFELSEAMHVRLSVWDISGHLVEWLVNHEMEAGLHQVSFEADDLPSGTYFVRMESEYGAMTRKMILRK